MIMAVNYLLAILGGVLLTLMVEYNSKLASYTDPFLAAWIAHGFGFIVSVVLVYVSSIFNKTHKNKNKIPLWYYLGGVPGAFTVVLAAVLVNNGMGLPSAIALMLSGQIIFGMIIDNYGLLDLPVQKINRNSMIAVILVIAGGVLVTIGKNVI